MDWKHEGVVLCAMVERQTDLGDLGCKHGFLLTNKK